MAGPILNEIIAVSVEVQLCSALFHWEYAPATHTGTGK